MIRNITSLRRAASASNVKVPGKPNAREFFPVTPDSGYFTTVLANGNHAILHYGTTATTRKIAHPLNKSARATRNASGPLTLTTVKTSPEPLTVAAMSLASLEG